MAGQNTRARYLLKVETRGTLSSFRGSAGHERPALRRHAQEQNSVGDGKMVIKTTQQLRKEMQEARERRNEEKQKVIETFESSSEAEYMIVNEQSTATGTHLEFANLDTDVVIKVFVPN